MLGSRFVSAVIEMPGIPDTRASLLIRLPDAGDIAAWDEFVGIYEPLVYRLARRKGFQHADAEELTQEVLLAVARAIEQWLNREGRGRFRYWLFRIARNLIVNFLTRPKFRTIGTGDSDVAMLLQQQPDNSSEESVLFELEYRREVFRWAAEQIRPTVREKTWRAFWMTTIDDLPVSRVAEILESSVGSIYIARSRVMARLRDEVQRFED